MFSPIPNFMTLHCSKCPFDAVLTWYSHCSHSLSNTRCLESNFNNVCKLTRNDVQTSLEGYLVLCDIWTTFEQFMVRLRKRKPMKIRPAAIVLMRVAIATCVSKKCYIIDLKMASLYSREVYQITYAFLLSYIYIQ